MKPIIVIAIAIFTLSATSRGESKFNRLSREFTQAGGDVVEKNFTGLGSSLWAGKCVRKNRPEKLVPGALSVLVEEDEIIGTSTFMGVKAGDAKESERAYLDAGQSETEESFQKFLDGELEVSESIIHRDDGGLYWQTHKDSELDNWTKRITLKVATTEQGQNYFIAYVSINSGSDTICYFSKRKWNEKNDLAPGRAPSNPAGGNAPAGVGSASKNKAGLK